MNKEEFDKLYAYQFVKDDMELELEKRLMRYYKESEGCSNQLAMRYWKDFKHWCNLSCITSKQINTAKKNVQHLIK